MDSKPALEKVESFIKNLLPDLDGVLAYMESKGGWMTFKPDLAALARRFKVGNYAEVYVDERRIGTLLLKLMEEISEPEEYKEAVEVLAKDPRGAVIGEWEQGQGLLDLFDINIRKSKAEREAAQREFDALAEEEKKKVIRAWQWFLAYFFSTFFNTLALMVHGRKLTDLVKAAEQGSDSALCLAAQIDRTTLVTIPYFIERVRTAHFEGDYRFFAKLGYRLGNPVLRGKIKYRQLWLFFALLDYFGYLDGSLKHRAILDLADRVGLGHKPPRIRDVETITKQLRLYRRFQEGHSISMQPK